MNTDKTPRRTRVERNIYKRADGRFEIGFKDASGKQRWRKVDGGITAARALRDQMVAQRNRGERMTDNNRLRFGDAADQWLNGPVVDLRKTTQDCYRNAVDNHLRARFGRQRLDAITPDDLANLVRELRAAGMAEASIVIALGVTNRIYRYAARRLGWAGTNPVTLMLPSERPKPSQTQRRRLFEGTELEETLGAAPEPYRTLFTVAALTGARLSELLGLTWSNLHLDPLDDAEIEFAHQIDRRGQIVPTKTAESARTIPIPSPLAQILISHRSRRTATAPADFVFATRSGRAFSQRNIARASAPLKPKPWRTTASRPSRPSIAMTAAANPYRSRPVPSRPCTASGTPSQAAPSLPAKVSTRSLSYSATETRTSLARSTCEKSTTLGDELFVDLGCRTNSAACCHSRPPGRTRRTGLRDDVYPYRYCRTPVRQSYSILLSCYKQAN